MKVVAALTKNEIKEFNNLIHDIYLHPKDDNRFKIFDSLYRKGMVSKKMCNVYHNNESFYYFTKLLK